MVDFGDGHALTYSNVSSIENGVKHVYKAVGIYRVTATGENSLGSESVVLYLHVTCESVLHCGFTSHGLQPLTCECSFIPYRTLPYVSVARNLQTYE